MAKFRIDIADIDAIVNITFANGQMSMSSVRLTAHSVRRTRVVFRSRIIATVLGARIIRIEIQFVVNVALQKIRHLIIAVGCKDDFNLSFSRNAHIAKNQLTLTVLRRSGVTIPRIAIGDFQQILNVSLDLLVSRIEFISLHQ